MVKGDHLAYRRAALVSLLGLAIQTVLTLLMFVYGKMTGDHGAVSATWLLGSGMIVWGVLLLVFDQQRRERLEAIEAEQLSSSSAAASAFEATTDDMRVAARRLATIQKFVVPAAGIVIASILISAGLLRLNSWRAEAEPLSALPDANGLSLSIGFGIAIVLFVFARFVSGMGTLKPWASLRAGAAVAVAASIVGLLIGVASFLELALRQDWFAQLVPYVIPVIMLLLGSETVLNLVLDLYRPRSPGEDPRPAFDSRLLGLIAAPDRIAESVGEAVNYQFGVDISSSWFYQLLVRRFVLLTGLGLLIAWLMTSLVVVGPHQRGLILTWGNVSKPLVSLGDVSEGGDVGPGMHIKLPWPISTFDIPTVETFERGSSVVAEATAGVRVLQLASSPPENLGEPVLWTESHTSQERLYVVQAGGERRSIEMEGVGGRAGSLSLVVAEVPVQYIVTDFKRFDEFAGPGQRERLLTAIGRRVVTRYLSQKTIDEALATARTTMPAELRRDLELAFSELNDGRGAGIEIQFVGVNGVHPPVKVAPNFERTVIARQNRESTVETGRLEKTRQLTEVAGSVELADQIVEKLDEIALIRGSGTPEETELEIQVQRLLEQAGGRAGEMLLSAGSQRWDRHMSERGRAALLRGQDAAYRAAPELFESKRYFEALLGVMRNARVYMTPGDLPNLNVRLELQDNDVGTDVFDPNAGAELNQ